MKYAKGDLFAQACSAIVIPTNGVVKQNGMAVMGAGVAKTARDRYVGIDTILGDLLREKGNHVHILGGAWLSASPERKIVSFPTKHDWRDPSNLSLIRRSAEELLIETEVRGWKKVCLPKVGSGLGQLPWSSVAFYLSKMLDDRFVIIEL